MNKDKGAGCTYESQGRSRPGVLSVPAGATSSSNVRKPPSRASINVPSHARTGPPSNLALITWSESSETTPSLSQSSAPHRRPPAPTIRFLQDFLPRTHDQILLGPSPDASVEQRAHETTKSIERPTASSFAVLPSVHFQSIPRPLRAPFSLIPPERVQVSCGAGSDLDMKLYAFLHVS